MKKKVFLTIAMFAILFCSATISRGQCAYTKNGYDSQIVFVSSAIFHFGMYVNTPLETQRAQATVSWTNANGVYKYFSVLCDFNSSGCTHSYNDPLDRNGYVTVTLAASAVTASQYAPSVRPTAEACIWW